MTRRDEMLPANPDRERQFVGALLWHGLTGERDATIADTPDGVFSDALCRKAFVVLHDMQQTGTLGDQTHALVKLSEAVGEVPAGELLATGGVRGAVLQEWQHELKALAHRRELIKTCRSAIAEAAEGRSAADIEADLAEARSRNTALYGAAHVVSMESAVARFTAFGDEVVQRHHSGHRLRFGVRAIDEHALWIPSYGLVLARTSHGKTAFAANVALNCARQGFAPVYFTLEQPAHQLVGRFLSLLTGRSFNEMLGLAGDAGTAAARAEAMRWLQTSRLTIVEGHHTADQIAGTAMRLATRGQCDAVFIDQMSRIDHRASRGETKEQAWTRSSNRLARLWQEIDAPVVLLAQLNLKLAIQDSRPSVAHVKDCGSLVEDACWVLMLDRPEADSERFKQVEKERRELESSRRFSEAAQRDCRGRIFIQCAKDRNSTMGGTRTVRAAFDRQSGAIRDERPADAVGDAGRNAGL